MTDKNLHQRLAAVMEEVTYVQKEKKREMRYSIVNHDAVTAKVRPVLLKHGIIYYPVEMASDRSSIEILRKGKLVTEQFTEVRLVVRFANIDDPKDFIDVPAHGHGTDKSDKSIGMGISYAVKYALLKALGLETGDDPDKDQEPEAPPVARRHEVSPEMEEELQRLMDAVSAKNGSTNAEIVGKLEKFYERPHEQWSPSIFEHAAQQLQHQLE